MRFLPAVLLALCLPLTARAEGRFALVIGTGDYDHVADLPNPGRDADAVADLLKSLGFKVDEEPDPDAEDLQRALADFAEDAAGAEVALVFYAGHGVEVAGENRLLPTDAATGSLEALAGTSLPLTEVAQTLATLAPAAILIVDACRNDPFAGTPLADATRGAVPLEEEAARPIAPGFARVGPAKGLLYAFSTAPGELAADGPEGANSPFTAALLRHLGKPGLELRTVLTLVTQDVHDRTRGAQTPYFESGLPELVFAAGQPEGLSERDALLLAMAGLSPDLRDEIDALATARAMPLAPLYAAALTLEADISREDRTRALTEAADAYASLQEQLATLSEADPRVAELRTAAAADLDLGLTEAAQQKFRDAIALDEAGREAGKDLYLSRTLSQAETLLLSAQAAALTGDLLLAQANLESVAALLAELDGLGEAALADTVRPRMYLLSGDIQMMSGELGLAKDEYISALVVSGELATRDPANTLWQRDLSVSHEKIGEVLHAQGDLPGALDSYRDSMAIRQDLAAMGNGSVEAELDLIVSHYKLSTVSPDPRPDLEAALAILLKLQSEGRLPPANDAWISILESELAALPPAP